MKTFSIPIRVYIEDTDAGGIVYYANYLKYMERARTEWLRSMGFELDVLQEQHRTLFVVRSVNIDYLMPARFNDQIIATLEVEQLKGASMSCKQAIICDDRLLTRASVSLACVNADTLGPCSIPNTIREAMTVER
ncbi:MAG: tol-pal system-associated acyl-CoA thioesterase [Granulosicoccus sp.]